MEITPLCMLLALNVFTNPGCTTDALSVSPDRSQFFAYKSVSLSCEEEQKGSSTGWRVMGGSAGGVCGSSWGSVEGSSCTIRQVYPSHTGVYWCESDSGQHSDAVNITVTDGDVILESPVLNVIKGEAVTLRCRNKTTPSNHTADFYKDGSLIRTESTGEMTIPAVSKSDEGLYKCINADLEESPESWLAVRGSSSSSPLIILFVVGAGVSVCLVVLLVTGLVLWRKRRDSPNESGPEDVRYSDVKIGNGPGTRKKRDTSGHMTYADVKIRNGPGTRKKRDSPKESGPEDVTYSDVTIKNGPGTRKKRVAVSLAVPNDEPSMCYSEIGARPQ